MWYFEELHFSTFGLLVIALFNKFCDINLYNFPFTMSSFYKNACFGIYITEKNPDSYCHTKRLFDISDGLVLRQPV